MTAGESRGIGGRGAGSGGSIRLATVPRSSAGAMPDPVSQPRHGLRTRILLLRRCAREAVTREHSQAAVQRRSLPQPRLNG